MVVDSSLTERIVLVGTVSCKALMSGKRESVSWQKSMKIDEQTKLKSGNAEAYARQK